MFNWVQFFYVVMLIGGACLIGYGCGWPVGIGAGLIAFSCMPVHREPVR